MTGIFSANGKTEVRITIDASKADVEAALPNIAAKLGFASVSGMTEVEFIAQETKQFWFDKYKEAVAELKEELAKEAAETKRLEVEAMIENSPLHGA